MKTRSGAQLAQLLAEKGIKNSLVLETIANTPRALFVPASLTHQAFENTALPIGQRQTISQPYTVARMTELLLEKVGKDSRVLEIGTGSGYQTAILASIFDQVCSVERIKTLQFQAKRRMNQLDLHNVKMKHSDGWLGWASKSPFDAIIVTAAASKMPQALLEQLADGGRLVIPIGDTEQRLMCMDKIDEQVNEQVIEQVNFVPLVSGEVL
ncbi:protein-L-isoaspartate(D-aspartate) O-methyltransferase [Glaciecola petra]|uniref:Protein-L-isoaspartate O-methyltransferase n=1 Tax=Glaciecola petra TaxID=3075602 RepID=A0ABU2ZLS6_9ALTE|nr:protein-L-isoaspartate(D-aspartate) O-methyltransferase [Aestuariibacter sp. P117]MDT0593289.1 protein-L-isoaspartate(D-aspartate) O-methyltransferase [Aestuariibacter sp. P117]